MERNRFVFEGLHEIEGRIRRLAKDVGYLAISDRTERNCEEPLGRFDFTMKDALPYLEQDGESAEPSEEDDEPEWPEEEGDDTEEPAEQAEPDAEGEPRDTDALAEAGCRWLRDIARRNTVGEPYRRFRVRVYTLKGARVLDTASFVCKNVDHDLDLPATIDGSSAPNEPELRIPTPSFDEAALAGASRSMKALGDSYAQWGQIVLGSVGQMQGVNNAMLARLHRQLQDSRNQVDQLVASILEFRVAELKASDELRAGERKDDQRTELARQALLQFGEVTKALFLARGVPPELGGLLGAIQQNQSLVSALSEPDVQALLEDHKNLEMLAGMLRQFGQQARMLREAATPPSQTS